MAQTKQAAKKPAAKAKTKSQQTRKKAAPPPPKSPVPKIAGMILSFFFGIFCIIGFFDVDAWLITYFCGFVKGVVGWGFYFFPLSLFICAWVLGFSRTGSTAFRVCCALLAPVFLGAVYHLFSIGTDWELGSGMLKQLYESGKAMTTGGVISGFLAIVLKPAVSIYGALPVFAISFIFFAMNSVGYTIPRIVDMFKEHRALEKERREYYAAEQARAPRAVKQPAIVKTPPETPVISADGGRKQRVIDIPIEDANQIGRAHV